MNAIVISADQFNELVDRINQIHQKLFSEISQSSSENIHTNEDLMKILGVSKSTLQTYRNKGLIGHHKIGRKIYYTQSDVEQFLAKNEIAPF